MLRYGNPSSVTVSTMPPPVESPTRVTIRPSRPVSTNFTALGCRLSAISVNANSTSAPASSASSKLRNSRASSGR